MNQHMTQISLKKEIGCYLKQIRLREKHKQKLNGGIMEFNVNSIHKFRSNSLCGDPGGPQRLFVKACRILLIYSIS